MMKIMKMVIALISMPMLALAGEEWVNGFCWSYAISNGEAEITRGSHGVKGVVIASVAVSGADLLPSASSSSQTIPAETAETSISIPSVLGGCPVVRIGNCAFQNCTWMKTKAVIPSTVTSIGECAFENCSGLTSVSIPSSVVQIGRYAFLGCGKLSTINVAQGDANRVKGMLSGENVAALTFVEQDSSSQSFRFESASADIQSDWYAELKEKKELAYLVVGEEQVKISDLTGNVYYFQKTNAKLSRSPVGWTLALYGAAIGGRGIQADGDLAVELAEGSANSIAITSYTTQLSPSGGYSGAAAYGMNIYGNLLIYGVGSLTINNLCRRSDGPILDGGDPAGINIGLDGWFGGSLTVGFGTSLSIHTTGYDGIHIDNGGDVDIVGASVELTGGRGIYTADAVSVKGSIVSILSVSGHCIQCGDFEGDYMFGAFAAKIGFAVNSGNSFSLDNSVACALTSQSPCIGGKNCFFGDGFYRLATDGSTMQAALLANRSLEIDGAEIECCAPGGIVACIQPASGSDATMTMKSGLLRNRRSMDVKSEFLLNSLWNDYYGLGAAYNSISLEEVVNPQVGLETFLGTALLDFIKSNGLKNPSGDAKYGIYGSDDVKFVMTDGTVILDASESGIHIKSGIKILGGSLKGVFDTTPVNANGQSLAMFEDTVFGAGAFSKASGGWNRSLPAYYGTQSLYTDNEGKLYFWLPESGNWNGGNDGGNGGGNGNSGGVDTSLPDLTYYIPDGWSQPVFVTTAKYDEKPVPTFVEGSPVYLKYAFKNTGNHLNVSNFIHRFTLSNGVTFQSTWSRSVLEYGKWGWPGDGWMPDALQRLPPGTYNVTCVLNATQSLAEQNHSNNTYTFSFTVVPANTSNVDLAFAAKSGLPAPVFITDSASGNTSVTEYAYGDPMYLRYSYRNAASAVAVTGFKLRIDLDGKEFITDSRHVNYTLIGGETASSYLSGATLAKIEPGRHTFTLTLDSENSIEEIDESNNVYTISFAVNPTPGIASLDAVTYSGYYTADKARVLTGGVFNGSEVAGVMSLKIGRANKKGVFKIGGTLTTLDGKKHTIKGSNPQVLSDGRTYIDITVKDIGPMNMKLYKDGFICTLANGWSALPANISSLPKGNMTFWLNPSPSGIIDGQNVIYTQYLPLNMTVQSTGTRLKVAAMAGRVVSRRGVVSVSKGGEANPSGLKITYTPKTGCWKGSFYIYTHENGRLKKYMAKVTGVTVEEYGFGVVTVNKLTFTPQIRAWLSL